MRSIYLIRHGTPDFPDGRRMCIGSTDLPLSDLGRLQAALLGAALSSRDIRESFCSPLSRSRETAALLGFPCTQRNGLEELFAGEWDGLSFDEICLRWPEVYALRGEDASFPPPGGETQEAGLSRFLSAFESALAASKGNIALVAHASVNQLLLCHIMGLPLTQARSLPLPYGSYTALQLSAGAYSVGEIGLSPRPPLDEGVCLRLLAALETPEHLVAHSRAVAQKALELCRALSRAGVFPDEAAVLAAALLHDIARREKDHAAAGAALLRQLGYPEVSRIIEQHHDLEDPESLDAAALVFLADKLTAGAAYVSLPDRFTASLHRCRTPEAKRAFDARYKAALTVTRNINLICGKDFVR